MCFGLGAMGGTVGDGVVGQRLYNASPVYATSFMGAAAVAGIFPWLFLVHADDYDGNDASAMSQKCAVAIFAGLLCSVTGVNVRAMTVNVNDPRERGTAFAWFNLTDDLGKGVRAGSHRVPDPQDGQAKGVRARVLVLGAVRRFVRALRAHRPKGRGEGAAFRRVFAAKTGRRRGRNRLFAREGGGQDGLEETVLIVTTSLCSL